MTLFDHLTLTDKMTVDRRAMMRDKYAPVGVVWRRVDSYGDALHTLNAVEYAPVVIIKEDGTAVVYSCGGSGVIWVVSKDGELSDGQVEMTQVFFDVLRSLGGVVTREHPVPPVYVPGSD